MTCIVPSHKHRGNIFDVLNILTAVSAVFYTTSLNLKFRFRIIQRCVLTKVYFVFLCVNVDRPSAPRRWGLLVNMERVMARR